MIPSATENSPFLMCAQDTTSRPWNKPQNLGTFPQPKDPGGRWVLGVCCFFVDELWPFNIPMVIHVALFKEIPGKKPIRIGTRYPRDDKWAKMAHALQDHEHEWYDTRTRYDWRSWPQLTAGWSSRGGWRLKILVTANSFIFHTRKHRSLEEVNKTSFWKQHGNVSWHTY